MFHIRLNFPDKSTIVNFVANDPGLIQACAKFLSGDLKNNNQTNSKAIIMAADITAVATRHLGNNSKTLLGVRTLAERAIHERTIGTKHEFLMISRALQNALCNCALEKMQAWQATCKRAWTTRYCYILVAAESEIF